ncbi:CGI-121-domain-containing protein [Ramicandelaber brevisporus]|nr:CGI-121-domain-containing protein [Ramicandelaber brevisporus]
MPQLSHKLIGDPSGRSVHISLFRNVANASDLRSRLIAKDTSLNVALIDATTVTSSFQLFCAAHNAASAETAGRLKSHNIHSETVFCMSPSPNIAEALRRFGISDASKDIIILQISDADGDAFDRMAAEAIHGAVDAESRWFENDSSELFESIADLDRIRKYYKIPATVTDRQQMNDLIATAIALKNV